MIIDCSKEYSTLQKMYRIEFASKRYDGYEFEPVDIYAYTTKTEAIKVFKAMEKSAFVKAYRIRETGVRKNGKSYNKFYEL